MKPKGKILVVDDSLDSLEMLTHILTRQGYEVQTAVSGELALASIAAVSPT